MELTEVIMNTEENKYEEYFSEHYDYVSKRLSELLNKDTELLQNFMEY